MSASTVRILVALDVPAADLRDSYGLTDLTALFSADSNQARDLQASLQARLDEFYPGQDGYVTHTSVVAVAVDSDGPGVLESLSENDLRGIYSVGIEGTDLDA